MSAIVGLCLAQDPAYAQLPMGAALMREESMPRFVNSLAPELRACLQEKKAISANLCKALLSPEPNPGLNNAQYEQIAVKYKKELNALQSINCDKPGK
ncbi:hypothetical protein LP420_12185 [Massilia sp. B-10]|nr:hypothetical protein LP420_12185 [Massilia sp. B-10]UUZ56001.1 hypothetical protein LP419_11640 [Massilia sp. H-1]